MMEVHMQASQRAVPSVQVPSFAKEKMLRTALRILSLFAAAGAILLWVHALVGSTSAWPAFLAGGLYLVHKGLSEKAKKIVDLNDPKELKQLRIDFVGYSSTEMLRRYSLDTILRYDLIPHDLLRVRCCYDLLQRKHRPLLVLQQNADALLAHRIITPEIHRALVTDNVPELMRLVPTNAADFNATFLNSDIAHGLAGFNNPAVSGQVNGIYITTNETNLAGTHQLLESHPRPERETIHIGCATWHNLDILCARKSTYGLILDFNPKNTEFIRKTVELIHACESRDAFKTAMIHYLHSLRGTERALFFHGDQRGAPTERIEKELERVGSWLQSEESYLYIKREVVSKGRLIAITEDIRNWENISKIRKFLDGKNIVIDTLYMSNICNFMNTAAERSSFMKSIRQLVDKSSIFISCPKIKQPNGTEIILNQMAILGDEILSGAAELGQSLGLSLKKLDTESD